jgi:WD40 repeat protein
MQNNTVWVSGVALLHEPSNASLSCVLVLKADGTLLLVRPQTSEVLATMLDTSVVCIKGSAHGPFAWAGCERKQGVACFSLLSKSPGSWSRKDGDEKATAGLVRTALFDVDAEAITSITESVSWGIAYDSLGNFHLWPATPPGASQVVRTLRPMLTESIQLSPVYCAAALVNILWVGTETGTVACYKLDAGTGPEAGVLVPLASATNHGAAVTTIEAVSQHEILLSGSEAGEVIVWDALTYDMLMRLTEHRGPVTAVAYVPWLSEVWTASADGAVLVWSCGGDLGAAFSLKDTMPVASGDYISSLCIVPFLQVVLGGGSSTELTCWAHTITTSTTSTTASAAVDPPRALLLPSAGLIREEPAQHQPTSAAEEQQRTDEDELGTSARSTLSLSPSPSPLKFMPVPTSHDPTPAVSDDVQPASASEPAFQQQQKDHLPAAAAATRGAPPVLVRRTVATSPPPQQGAAVQAAPLDNIAVLQEIEALRSRQAKQVEQLTAEIASQRASYANVLAEVDSLKATIAAKNESMQQMQEELTAARQHREHLGRLVESLADQKKELQAEAGAEVARHAAAATELALARRELLALRSYCDDVLVPAVDAGFERELAEAAARGIRSKVSDGEVTQSTAAVPPASSNVESMLEALMREVRFLKSATPDHSPIQAQCSTAAPHVAVTCAETQTEPMEDYGQLVRFLERVREELVLPVSPAKRPQDNKEELSAGRMAAASLSSPDVATKSGGGGGGGAARASPPRVPMPEEESTVTIPAWLLHSLQTQLQLVESLLRQHREAINRSSPVHTPATSTSILTSSYLTIRRELGPDQASRVLFEALQDDCDEVEATEMLILALCRRCCNAGGGGTVPLALAPPPPAQEQPPPRSDQKTPRRNPLEATQVLTATRRPAHGSGYGSSLSTAAPLMAPASSPPREAHYQQLMRGSGSPASMWRKLERSNLI